MARREDRLADLMTALGPGHDALVADLASPEGLRATAGRLSGCAYTLLVNNAGTAVHGGFATTSLPDSLVVVDLNCRALVTRDRDRIAGRRRRPVLAGPDAGRSRGPGAARGAGPR